MPLACLEVSIKALNKRCQDRSLLRHAHIQTTAALSDCRAAWVPGMLAQMLCAILCHSLLLLALCCKLCCHAVYPVQLLVSVSVIQQVILYVWCTGKTSKTELAKLILAQDLFGLWGDELTPVCTATLIGCQKWAGDEVAPVSLLVYLRDSVPAAQPLMVSILFSSFAWMMPSQAAC